MVFCRTDGLAWLFMPKSDTRPPIRVRLTHVSSWSPTASTTTSAPIASVSALTTSASDSSRTLIVRCTPASASRAKRSFTTSATITRAPEARKSSACRAPTGPPPMTSAVSPGSALTMSVLLTTQDSTSVQMASSNGTRSAIGWHARSGTTFIDARPPSRKMPNVVKFTQWLTRPILQKRHVPQLRFGAMATRSPGFRAVTPAPTSMMRPMYSWPMITPTVAGWPGGRSRMCRSVPQMPHPSTATSTSSGRAILGTGRS